MAKPASITVTAFKSTKSDVVGRRYSLRVGKEGMQLFPEGSTSVEVRVGRRVRRLQLAKSFQTTCPEIRDHDDGLIREWLSERDALVWEKNHPPRFRLVYQSGQLTLTDMEA